MSHQFLHNPRCSKSREALALLRNEGIDPVVREYLKDPLDPDELRELFTRLGGNIRDYLRKGEKIYRELDLGNPEVADSALIKAIAEHPIILERPVFLTDQGAVIGRPPEKVLALLAQSS